MNPVEQNTYSAGANHVQSFTTQDAPNKNHTTTITTTTNAYSSDGGNMVFMSLFIFLMAIFLLFFVRVGLGFCLGYRRNHTCAETCVKFISLKWICDECSRDDQSADLTSGSNNNEPGNVQPSATSLSLYDLPDYEDALNLPRLDSSTILGDPPPLYRSLEKTKRYPIYDGGHENSNFVDQNDMSARQNDGGYLREIIEASDVSGGGTSVNHETGSRMNSGSSSEECDAPIQHITLPRALRSRVFRHQNQQIGSNDSYVSNNADMVPDNYQFPLRDEALVPDPEPTEQASNTFVRVSFTIEEPETLPSYQEALEIIIGTNL